MQADRGFTLSHQKVALELGFSGVLAGFTELTIVPSNAALRHIYLHARCMAFNVCCAMGKRSDLSTQTLYSLLRSLIFMAMPS